MGGRAAAAVVLMCILTEVRPTRRNLHARHDKAMHHRRYLTRSTRRMIYRDWYATRRRTIRPLLTTTELSRHHRRSKYILRDRFPESHAVNNVTNIIMKKLKNKYYMSMLNTTYQGFKINQNSIFNEISDAINRRLNVTLQKKISEIREKQRKLKEAKEKKELEVLYTDANGTSYNKTTDNDVDYNNMEAGAFPNETNTDNKPSSIVVDSTTLSSANQVNNELGVDTSPSEVNFATTEQSLQPINDEAADNNNNGPNAYY